LFYQERNIDIKEALQSIKTYNHLCLIYDTPEEWHNIVHPFLIVGLEQGDKCIIYPKYSDRYKYTEEIAPLRRATNNRK